MLGRFSRKIRYNSRGLRKQASSVGSAFSVPQRLKKQKTRGRTCLGCCGLVHLMALNGDPYLGTILARNLKLQVLGGRDHASQTAACAAGPKKYYGLDTMSVGVYAAVTYAVVSAGD